MQYLTGLELEADSCLKWLGMGDIKRSIFKRSLIRKDATVPKVRSIFSEARFEMVFRGGVYLNVSKNGFATLELYEVAKPLRAEE